MSVCRLHGVSPIGTAPGLVLLMSRVGDFHSAVSHLTLMDAQCLHLMELSLSPWPEAQLQPPGHLQTESENSNRWRTSLIIVTDTYVAFPLCVCVRVCVCVCVFCLCLCVFGLFCCV